MGVAFIRPVNSGVRFPPLKSVVLQTLKGFIKRMSRKPEAAVGRVRTTAEGFVANWEDGRTEVVEWSEVERIFTYKVDCYAYDTILLAFERGGREDALHLREEVEGFQDLMSAMGKAFPSIDPEWYLNVMQPPFAENLTLLFEREAKA